VWADVDSLWMTIPTNIGASFEEAELVKDGIDLKSLSRKVSYALRHDAEKFALRFDEEGWTSAEDVVVGIRAEQPSWRHLQVDHLRLMIESSRVHRHEISGGKIKALYGHSNVVEPKRVPSTPPELLYHGTNEEAARMILEVGLQAKHRSHVHLTTSRSYALRARSPKNSRPVILLVAGRDAGSAGIVFYLAGSHVWLADPIPPKFIRRELEMVR
jgi:putative RNA 2'-phosphotransferase